MIMRKILLLVFSTLVFNSAHGQTNTAQDDTLYSTLPEVRVKARFENDTERYHYNQTKFYITTILPYLNAATKVFNEINTYEQNPSLKRREKKDFVHTKEDELRDQFEDNIKKLNVTQGKLLVTLIARQTGVNIYSILKDFKNPLTAVKWQMWARVNGMNLDRKYQPDEEPMLENIMYELGYPLPACYADPGLTKK